MCENVCVRVCVLCIQQFNFKIIDEFVIFKKIVFLMTNTVFGILNTIGLRGEEAVSFL